MPSVLVSHALTTAARVKSRLGIADATTTWDTLIEELINGATDIIEVYVGRRFKSTTYTQQVYTLYSGQKMVFLKAWPITTLTAVQYRAGTPSTPAWTDMPTDDYEIDEDPSPSSSSTNRGILRIYAALQNVNALRVTYVAGYTINFSTGHTLPYSISEICEKMVVHRFKKRTDEGKQSDNATGAAVTWFTDDIPTIDKKTLDEFKRVHFS